MRLRILALASACGIATMSHAANIIPYPDSGTYNEQVYTFTAASTGSLVGYFAGSGASYDNQVGVLVNGVPSSAGFGLDNHSSNVGDSFDFGNVTAGDVLTFVLRNLTTESFAYSDPTLNVAYDVPGYIGGHNHIYSTSYDGTDGGTLPGVPAGIYVAFEDLAFPNTDYNYDDESFVFVNAAVTTSDVPEAGSWMMMIAGFGAIGGMLRQRRTAIRFA